MQCNSIMLHGIISLKQTEWFYIKIHFGSVFLLFHYDINSTYGYQSDMQIIVAQFVFVEFIPTV